MDRRKFIRTSAAAALVGTLGRGLAWSEPAKKVNGMPHRILGHTGESVSLVGVGGYHIGDGSVPVDLAVQIIRTALDNGVNFLDNSWDYNNGESELRMGKALRNGYRDKAFVMTKLDARTAVAADQQLNQSLSRLQLDYVDLLQIHEVIRMSDADRVFGPGGTIEALVKAKKAGKIRYIGFTGHKSPDIHLHMLEVADKHGFVFDSVQMPLNVMDAHFNSFTHRVLPVLVKKNIGALGMKSLAFGKILESKTVTPVECLQFTMNLPVSVCITGCDSMQILQQALDTARSFKHLTPAEVAAILAKTEAVAQNGQYELYKTSDQFDTTTHFPGTMG